MNLNQKNFSIGCYSIRTLQEQLPPEHTNQNYDIIYQKSVDMHLHQVKQGYQILSKNDFGKVKKRINLGIFNKKTNFIVGEKHSLLFWDIELKQIHPTNISEVLKNPKRYYMIYDLNFIGDFINKSLNIVSKKDNTSIKLTLDRQFGIDIGTFLRTADPKNDTIPEEFKILKSMIRMENSRLSINKQVLINSNPEFLIGILEGYIENSRYFQLKSNINIYNFTYILNLLGAQYSIRSVQDGEKHIRFKLPLFLKGIFNTEPTTLVDIYFREYKYIFDIQTKELTLKNGLILNPLIGDADFYQLVNSGFIEMVPAKDLVFLPLEGENIMYDLTMPNANATNYSLPGMPSTPNSDGDVLQVTGLMTKDAAEEATRKFSTELKENFLNLSTGNVSNWGVHLDAQLGLYSATK